MRSFSDLPSTLTPINSTNLNGAQTDILNMIGLGSNTWSSSGTYAIGDIVVYDYKLYKNITGTNTNTNPSSDTTNWQETTILVS